MGEERYAEISVEESVAEPVPLCHSSSTLNTNRVIINRVNASKVTPQTFGPSCYRTSATYVPIKHRVKTASQLTVSLIWISGFNALLSWTASLLGFLVSARKDKDDDTREYIKLTLVVISLIQVAVILPYWQYSLKYSEVLRCTFKLSPEQVIRLRKSPKDILICSLESAFHLITFVPWGNFSGTVTLFGVATSFSIDELLYFVILLRNYHTLRLLYWCSRFSDVRTHLYTRLIGVKMNLGFVFRCFLAAYGLKFILGMYVGTMLIFGFVQFAVEDDVSMSATAEIFDKFWLVSYTQMTIGYGENSPVTFFGQVTVLFSCFFGIFVLGFFNSYSKRYMNLSLRECSLYSELLYTREKTKTSYSAVILLQQWWRFLQMRHRGCKHALTIINFYTQLRRYRGTLADCQGVKDHRFERQLYAFRDSTRRRISPLNEYLRPVIYSQSLVIFTQVIDIFRNAYRINTKAWKLSRGMRKCHIPGRNPYRLLVTPVSTPFHSPEPRDMSRELSSNSGRSIAKAKIFAYRNVRGRLIRDIDTTSPSPSSDDRDQTVANSFG